MKISHNKRLSGYAAIGYKAKGDSAVIAHTDIIFDKNSFLSVYSNDIINAEKEVLIVSPFVTKRRVSQVLKYFNTPISKQVKITIITRPSEDFKEKDTSVLCSAIDVLKSAGINVLLKSNIHQKFAVIDQRVVWYGSINLLSYGNAEESIMRLESHNIANELIRSLVKI